MRNLCNHGLCDLRSKRLELRGNLALRDWSESLKLVLHELNEQDRKFSAAAANHRQRSNFSADG